MQDQGRSMPGLSALYPGQGRLCSYGLLVPPDEGHKQNLEKFLDYIENTLDDEISPQVCVYELEDVKKRPDESVNELIDRIHQLAHHAQIGNGSDAAIEFEVQCRLI